MSLTSVDLPVQNASAGSSSRNRMVVLVGNPNSGKSTLFNRLTGLVNKTANHPGTTVDVRRGILRSVDDARSTVTIIDSPGTYGLESTSPEESVTRDLLTSGSPSPDQVVMVIDATHLQRGLPLAFQVIEIGIPTIVVLSMVDLAGKRGIQIDVNGLSTELRCRVIPVSSRTGENVATLSSLILDGSPHASLLPVEATPTVACPGCNSCPYAARFDRAELIAGRIVDVSAGGAVDGAITIGPLANRAMVGAGSVCRSHVGHVYAGFLDGRLSDDLA